MYVCRCWASRASNSSCIFLERGHGPRASSFGAPLHLISANSLDYNILRGVWLAGAASTNCDATMLASSPFHLRPSNQLSGIPQGSSFTMMALMFFAAICRAGATGRCIGVISTSLGGCDLAAAAVWRRLIGYRLSSTARHRHPSAAQDAAKDLLCH